MRFTYGDQPNIKPTMSPHPGYPTIMPTTDDLWALGLYNKRFSVGYFNNLGGDCNQIYDSVTSGAITWETSAVTKDNCEYTICKWGKLVTIYIKIYVKSAISSMTTLGVLNSSYRPKTTQNLCATIMSTSSAQHQRAVQLHSNGNIRMPYASASSNDSTCYYVQATYFTD